MTRAGALPRTIAAHALAFGMALFGSAKFLRTMFVVTNATWDTPVAQLDGISATWAYFGSSVYGRLLGLLEIGIAVLVLVPRLRVMGAAAAAALLANIVVLDVCYDVRPGLWAALALLALSLSLLGVERERLAAAWRALTDRPAPPARGALVLAALTLAAGLLALVPVARRQAAARTWLDGVWRVERMTVAGAEPRPPWGTVYFELAPDCAVRAGSLLVPCAYTVRGHELTLRMNSTGAAATLHGKATLDESGRLSIVGRLGDQPADLVLGRRATPPGGRP